MNKYIVILGILLLGVLPLVAQDEYPKIEIPVGFSFVNVHPNTAQLTSFNVFGGGGGFVYNVSNWVGIKADFFGYTQGSGQKLFQGGQLLGNVSGNVFTYLFGPQIKKHSGKFQPFGEALFGAAHTNLDANICKLEGGCGSGSGNNNGFAMEFGGGLDIPITKTIQFRPVEVDYLGTHFGANHVKNYSAWQANFKYVAGVNFTFGK
jgi:hypothetical protein